MTQVSLPHYGDYHIDYSKDPINGKITFNRDYSGWQALRKADGVHGVVRTDLDTPRLMGRGGWYAAPDWWLASFKNEHGYVFQGELIYLEKPKSSYYLTWEDADNFHQSSGVCRRKWPQDADWKNMYLAVFDLWQHPGTYEERGRLLRKELSIQATKYPQARIIPSLTITSNESLAAIWEDVQAAGSEGLVLYRPGADYQLGKAGNMHKIVAKKRHEAVIIDYIQGGGKYVGMVGAYLCKFVHDEKVVFQTGSGLQDWERRAPYPIGSLIVVEHKGLNHNGWPTQPIYKGIRNPQDLDHKDNKEVSFDD